MPNINLRDGRKRDAVVHAEHIGQVSTVRTVDRDGRPSRLQKVLKATSEHGLDRLVAMAGDADKLAASLVAGDPDVDTERVGMFLTQANRVYVNDAGEIVYSIEQTEILRTPAGEVKERRPRHRAEQNIDGEVPITWTGRLVKKDEAMRRFVFSSKLQIMHVNGLTYDFLYGMAKELADAGSLMLLGAGKSGKDPLVFRRGMTPHRGFLEGRINGDKYVLLLHLSKMELKRPAVVQPVPVVQPVEQLAAQAAVQPAAVVTPPAPVADPVPLAASVAPHKPSVAEVIAALGNAPAATTPGASDTAATPAVAAKSTRKRKAADKAADPTPNA